MKRYCLAIVVVALFAVVCRQEQETADTSLRDHPKQPVDTQSYYDSILSVILARQDAVFARPAETRLIDSLLCASFDSSSGAFYVAGKATFNPDYPESAREKGRERAARYAGERWALYLKSWHTGPRVRFGTSISGTIAYSKEMHTRQQNDTLYELLLIPVGSVVVESEDAAMQRARRRHR
jgi:hypothetical protein